MPTKAQENKPLNQTPWLGLAGLILTIIVGLWNAATTLERRFAQVDVRQARMEDKIDYLMQSLNITYQARPAQSAKRTVEP